ncbi:MAG: hypothetical protein N2C12_16345, partial [Planctomycetales bacterium]
MSAFSIELGPTIELHQRLAEAKDARADEYCRALDHANQRMAHEGVDLQRRGPLDVALSALVLAAADLQVLQQFTHRLHGIIEKILGQLTADADQLASFFPHHQRIFPFIRKTSGTDNWQIVSRYDVAVSPNGDLKIMEINTGCPGGLLVSDSITSATKTALELLQDESVSQFPLSGTVDPQGYIDGLLGIERQSNIDPATIALLNDENQLTFELGLLADALEQRQRKVVIADARELTCSKGHLQIAGEPVSMSCNKFRISTPDSPNHSWR